MDVNAARYFFGIVLLEVLVPLLCSSAGSRNEPGCTKDPPYGDLLSTLPASPTQFVPNPGAEGLPIATDILYISQNTPGACKSVKRVLGLEVKILHPSVAAMRPIIWEFAALACVMRKTPES